MSKRETAKTRKPPDQRERDAIVTRLDTTMLVEASAGSGKTRSMVDRMVALLSRGKCPVETLAAITFTRKAAAELRSRFQVALEKAAHQSKGLIGQRLGEAANHVERVFIGTIHSFCGCLLRERPVEAGVEPGFQELEESTDGRLKQEAWTRYVADLIATNDPILAQLDELGLEVGDLEETYGKFSEYPDVDQWPAETVDLPDLGPIRKPSGTGSFCGVFGAKCACPPLDKRFSDRLLGPVREALVDYVAHMEKLGLPEDPGNDKLMPRYDRIVRMVRQVDLDRPADLMEVLGQFRTFNWDDLIKGKWPGESRQARRELDRWNRFTETTVEPVIDLWRQVRYPVVLRVLEGAVKVYDQVRREAGGLNYQDLLLQAAALLRDKPQVRRYFRRRFTHILVDEFQDTDPIQAEVILLATAEIVNETDWRRCTPVPGALFVVGDPKQSIYRFRRADIVTYNEVKRIIQETGEIVVLCANFRSLKPLVQWVNSAFDRVFPAEADTYSPANSPMEPVHGSGGEDAPGGVQVLTIPGRYGNKEQVVEYESEFIARAIRSAVRSPGSEPARTPGDFLIISARKRFLSIYARKLAELGIPCEVTGGAVLNEVCELGLLCLCLEAVTEPDNPLALVAVLRSGLFGLSDAVLYAFKRSGGRFSFHSPIPDGLAPEVAEPLEDAFGRLRRYDLWLKRLPLVAAIERIVTDLGLAARAAIGPGGNVRAGSIGRALELIRGAQSTLYSVAEAVGYLRQLIDATEKHDGLPATVAEETPVRIMNLHQAKGLEAPVVFLADPTGYGPHEPKRHIDRTGSKIRGYMRVTKSRSEWHHDVLAHPPGWETWSAEEERFQQAEQNRLLYVASTRAETRLVVAQRRKGNEKNPWSPLLEHLIDCAEMAAPKSRKAAPEPARRIKSTEPGRAARAIGTRWNQVLQPTYTTAAAKAISVTGSRPMPSAGEHGTEWGTVIHLLLESSMRFPKTDLRSLAYSSLEEHGLDPALGDIAVKTVKAVMSSQLWSRAQASPQRLVEVPFQTLTPDVAAESGVPTLLRGVIDLVFREQGGWVIVDYKTDACSETDVPKLTDHYRGQVETYARVWRETTKEPVGETGLFFTHTGVYVEV